MAIVDETKEDLVGSNNISHRETVQGDLISGIVGTYTTRHLGAGLFDMRPVARGSRSDIHLSQASRLIKGPRR